MAPSSVHAVSVSHTGAPELLTSQPIFNSFSFADNPSGGTLTPLSEAERGQGLAYKLYKRCPGTASQPPADNSAPFRDTNGQLDCDPNAQIPGP